MKHDAIERVQEHYEQLTKGPRLAQQFYEELFARAPGVRSLFPQDLSGQLIHFEQTLAMVIDNLGHIAAVDTNLRDLGARHLRFGAQPQHYLVVRDALLAVLERLSGPSWTLELQRAWMSAINAILVPMLRGAAVETAALAQMLAGEE